MVVNGYNGAMPSSPAALQLSIPDRVKGCCQPVAAPIADAKAEELAEMFKVLGDPTRV